MRMNKGLARRACAVAAALATGLVVMPAASAEDAAAETVDEARTRILGAGWDDPNVIRFRTLGNTTWLVSYGGTLVMHDSTVEDQLTDTGEDRNTNGYVSVDDVVAAKPDVILQNHTHFDQQHNATDVATRAGTPFVTDMGGCLFTKITAIKKGQDPAKLKCNLIRDAKGKPFFTPDTWAGGLPGIYTGQGLDLGLEDLLGPLLKSIPLKLLGQEVDLTAFLRFTDYGEKGWPETKVPGLDKTMAIQVKHSPSFTGRPYPNALSGPRLNLEQNIKDILEDYAGNPLAIAQSIYEQYAPFDLEGSNVGWYVKYKDFSLFHHGSTGPTYGLEPGAKEIRESLKTLGVDDRVDIEVGGVAEMTFFTDANYFADNKDYAKAIGAKKFFPTHHYNWYPLWLTNPAATYWPGVKKTWDDGKTEAGAAFPDLCYLTEDNYASLWDLKANQWAGAAKGQMTPLTGPGCYTG